MHKDSRNYKFREGYLPEHGSNKTLRWHYRHNIPPCESCLQAGRRRRKDYRDAKRKERELDLLIARIFEQPVE